MSDIFISYKREDESRVSVLRDALNDAGLDVWWDREIAGGEKWRQRIQTELDAARCVLVVWSEASIGPAGDFVMDEANRAKHRGTLLQIRIDDVNLPLGFGEQQALDLLSWNGKAEGAGFQDVVAAAKALIDRKPIPAPKAPRRRKAALWGAVSIASVGTVAGLLGNLLPLLRTVCSAPGVSAACGALGVGGAPSAAEKALWSGRRPGDCQKLKTYLSEFPNGAYAQEAQARLLARKVEDKETWKTEQLHRNLVVRSTLEPFAGQAAARSDALARALKEAQRACAGLNQAEYRTLSARAAPTEWRCTERLGGHACGFDGEAICEVSARYLDRMETCP
ncbi:MAG: toll/interleukin-1 receptor domain-containing protein [Bryobacterales bacterium]|nr:toll/interleukin-1 receptor domain-containing protein [Bryobacterales bacterium]